MFVVRYYRTGTLLPKRAESKLGIPVRENILKIAGNGLSGPALVRRSLAGKLVPSESAGGTGIVFHRTGRSFWVFVEGRGGRA